MSWAKLDDQFFRHPKVIEAGRDARDLYLAALCYCANGLTDGFVSERALPMLAVDAGVTRPAALAARLVTVGLWSLAPGGYSVHDYEKYNPSAAQVKHDREQTAHRQAEWRKRTSGVTHAVANGVSNGVTASVSNGQHNGPVTGAPSPSPSNTYIPPLPPRHIPPVSDAETTGDMPSVAPAALVSVPVVDNFTPWFAELWAAYPARRGKKLNKQSAQKVAKSIAARDWDRVLIAVRNYAASEQGVKGVVEDAHRFLRHWQDWEEPEAPPAATVPRPAPRPLNTPPVLAEMARRRAEAAERNGIA